MGLREQQKTKRTERILAAAADLFAREGFGPVKAEKIAQTAGVSVGTLYNYFPGKNKILLTLIAIENERLEDIARTYAPDFEGPVADIFCGFLLQYFAPQNMLLNKDLWRTGFALSFADVSTPEARRLRKSDRVLSQQTVALTQAVQAKGLLRSDLDAAVFGAMLFNNANMQFLDFARSENRSFEAIKADIATMTRVLVQIALPSR